MDELASSRLTGLLPDDDWPCKLSELVLSFCRFLWVRWRILLGIGSKDIDPMGLPVLLVPEELEEVKGRLALAMPGGLELAGWVSLEEDEEVADECLQDSSPELRSELEVYALGVPNEEG